MSRGSQPRRKWLAALRALAARARTIVVRARPRPRDDSQLTNTLALEAVDPVRERVRQELEDARVDGADEIARIVAREIARARRGE